MHDFPKRFSRQTEGAEKKPIPLSSLARHLITGQLAIIIFALDQFTKYVVRQLLPYRSSFPDQGFFRFTHTHNTGSAFGILQGQNSPLIFIAIIGITLLLIIYFTQPKPNKWLSLSIGLQIGGAVGNLVDRLHQGWVTDFLDAGPWPVFNIADSSIVIGLILLCWIYMRPSSSLIDTKTPLRKDEGSICRNPSWCPECGGNMIVTYEGWRCGECGASHTVQGN
ncbi:MAG: signal peptidase II [Chloroflexota bacterium]|nr:signal peptidase II [Chloroflexota bacterium]